MTSLHQLTEYVIYLFFLILCRVTSIIMTMPGVGESYITPRVRILLSLGISLILLPMIEKTVTSLPNNQLQLFMIILNELIIGFSIGLMIRMILSVTYITGSIISVQSGLASASLFDPNNGVHGSIEGNFLSAVTLVLIFVLDIHYLIIAGIFETYKIFQFGHFPDYAMISKNMALYLNNSFLIAIKLASAHLVVGTLINISAGLMARLMPQMQLIFLMMPVQIFVSFLVFGLILSSILVWYMDFLREAITSIFIK